jgi:hypothetical protein
MFAQVQREMPPVRGIINSAGALADATLVQQSWNDFRRVLSPKMDGSWHLHEASLGLSLDFFVLFSSVASVLGAPGQANHSAANAFEDALAYVRRAQGLPAVSINWGAWSELGAAVRDDLEQRRARIGVGVLSPDEAIELFAEVLRDNPVQIAAARMDWPTFAAQRPARGAAWLSTMARTMQSSGTSARAATTSATAMTNGQTQATLLSRIAAAPESQRFDVLGDQLEEIARGVLGFSASRRIDRLQPLQELGLDSLMAVEFRNALSNAIERPLPATLLFSYPALEDIANHLANDVLGLASAEVSASESAPAAAAPSAPQGSNVLDSIEDMSDEDIDRLFAQQLQKPVS